MRKPSPRTTDALVQSVQELYHLGRIHQALKKYITALDRKVRTSKDPAIAVALRDVAKHLYTIYDMMPSPEELRRERIREMRGK